MIWGYVEVPEGATKDSRSGISESNSASISSLASISSTFCATPIYFAVLVRYLSSNFAGSHLIEQAVSLAPSHLHLLDLAESLHNKVSRGFWVTLRSRTWFQVLGISNGWITAVNGLQLV